MNQQEFVKECKDCPLFSMDYERGYFCNHTTLTEIDDFIINQYYKGNRIPDNCPLKEGPITIQLSKFE